MFFPNNICVTDRLRWHHVGVGYKENFPLGDQTRIPPSHSPDLSHALPVTIWCTELVFETMKLFGLILGILGWLCLNIRNPQIGCLYLGAIWGYTPLSNTPVGMKRVVPSLSVHLRVSCPSWPLFILFFSSRIFTTPTEITHLSTISNTQPVGKGHLWKSMRHLYLLGFDTPPSG